jgi:iron complex transport system substrate-binding protein
MNPLYLTDPLEHFHEHTPNRVVSLVPSTTASLFDLGLEDVLVGVSEFCIYPDQARKLPKFGGPRSINTAAIIDLHPDLVLANREENNREAIESLLAAGVPVWLTFPKTVRESIADLWSLARLFRSDSAMERVRLLEKSLEWAELSAGEGTTLRYFCPIWEDRLETGERWWMTFNQHTYSHDVLHLFNGENIFSGRARRYPLLAELGHADAQETGDRDTRYPRVSYREIIDGQPDLILLPDEPYTYGEQQALEFMELFSQTPAARAGRIYVVDGSLLTWPGTRLAKALAELSPYFS